MARAKYIVLLPLVRNDGAPVSKVQLDGYLAELFALADGYTVAGTVTGAYRTRSGKKQIDRNLELWIVVDESQQGELRNWLANIGAELGQEAMYFEKSRSKVTYVKPKYRDESNHEGED